MITLFQRSRWENREDGRFFAAFRMTGLAITIDEKYRSDLRSALNDRLADRQIRCFPLSYRGGLRATSAKRFRHKFAEIVIQRTLRRPTKDLLQHGKGLERLTLGSN